MQSPKLSLAGYPLARPNAANACEAASAMSPLKGMTETCGSLMYSSSQRELWRAKFTGRQMRVSTRGRRADRAVFGGKKIDQLPRVLFELDDAYQDRAVEHDYLGKPVA